jgi:hypothetical protein
MMTVRDMIHAIQTEIRTQPDLPPGRASELLNELSTLIGNCNEEIRVADGLYSGVLLFHYNTEATANRAKIHAEASPEYQRKREARDTKELALTMIASLKYYLRGKAEEMRLTR